MQKKNKTSRWIIFIVVAILISVFYFGNNPKSIEPTTIPQKQYTFSGTSKETLKVNLNKGLAVFRLKANCNGTESIAVDLRKNDGTYYKGHLFNELGTNWSGSTSLNINEKGTYIINVEINGTWELKIE